MRMSSISAAHPQVRGSGDGLGEVMAPNSEAATLSSTQKATSHLSSRVPFVLDSVAIFWCEGLGRESDPSMICVALSQLKDCCNSTVAENSMENLWSR